MGDRQREIEQRLYEKWTGWIEHIYEETVTLFAYRSFYRGVVEMIGNNDDIPGSSFFDAFGAWYATTQAVAVRRQTDKDDRAVSLARLLTNMAAHPNVMTRDRFLSLWPNDEHYQRRGSEGYDSYASAGIEVIPPAVYETDLKRFETAAAPVRDYVDRLVAHNDQRQLTRLPTWGELNDVIDLLEEMLNKYMVLLKAQGVPSADPVHQAEWKEAFRVAWLV